MVKKETKTKTLKKSKKQLHYKESHLYKHVTDFTVPSFSRSVERCAFILGFHFKVWVYTINWRVKKIQMFHQKYKNQMSKLHK